MPKYNIKISKTAEIRLRVMVEELGSSIEKLMEEMIEEDALEYYYINQKDDPAKIKK